MGLQSKTDVVTAIHWVCHGKVRNCRKFAGINKDRSTKQQKQNALASVASFYLHMYSIQLIDYLQYVISSKFPLRMSTVRKRLCLPNWDLLCNKRWLHKVPRVLADSIYIDYHVYESAYGRLAPFVLRVWRQLEISFAWTWHYVNNSTQIRVSTRSNL
jgi:hypothetical protein